MSFYVHETAVIDEGASIGSGSKIWHFSHLMGSSKIGDNCILGQNVFIGNNVSLGNGVKVQNNVSIYEGVYCEDDVFLGPSMVFTNVLNPRSAVERKAEFKTTTVKRGATIGANATILCGISIGKYALIGAGAVVLKDVKDFEMVAGNPARSIGWISSHGNKLNFVNDEAFCSSSNKKYRIKNQEVFEEND